MSYPEKSLKPVDFGEFTFDCTQGCLTRNGRDVRLRPRALRALQLLVANADRIVTREELRDSLWTGRVVEWEMGLHSLIRELRAVLADDARNPRFIQTVPRRGYRFIAATTPGTASRAVSGGDRKAWGAHASWFVAGLLALPGSVLVACVYLGFT